MIKEMCHSYVLLGVSQFVKPTFNFQFKGHDSIWFASGFVKSTIHAIYIFTFFI